ncbi:tetratricopeptide repeat protein [uncultured Microscilla sp.]|uniref:tetratricopeptide repeat protein n=1 Tax=uncultured Microscilla sp. TaxID=432653 RepID=UPI0026266D23|nr:tetratricopeptide repeat protein [uncultured Microscilla sp.]
MRNFFLHIIFANPLVWLMLLGGTMQAQTKDALRQQIKTTTDRTKKCQLLLQLATLELKQNQADNALLHAQRGLTLVTKQKPIVQAKALLLMGRAYMQKQQYPNALEHHLQAQIIAKNIQNTYLINEANQALGDLYYHWQIYDKALSYYLLVKSNVAPTQAATNAQRVSLIYSQYNKKTEAIRWATKALQIYKSLDNTPEIITTLRKLSALSQRNGQNKQAIAYNEAIIQYKDKMEPIALVEPYNNIGFLYKQQKQYDTALDYYNQALKISKQTLGNDAEGSKRHIKLLTNIAVILIHLDQPKEAKINYYKAIDLAKEQKDALLTADLYNHLAAYQYIYNKNFSAIDYAQEAVNIATPLVNDAKHSTNAHKLLTTSYQLLANAYQKEENYPQAKKYLQLYNQAVTTQQQAQQQKKTAIVAKQNEYSTKRK